MTTSSQSVPRRQTIKEELWSYLEETPWHGMDHLALDPRIGLGLWVLNACYLGSNDPFWQI